MRAHHIVVLNRSQLQVYRAGTEPGRPEPHCQLIEAADFRAAYENYTGGEADAAARVPRGADNGMKGDERLPMQEELQRRQVAALARTLETFLRRHPGVRWDYAAGPGLHYAVLDRLPADLRGAMERAAQKDLTKVPPDELLRHFPAPVGRG